MVTGITIDPLLLEDPRNVYEIGSAIYHDKSRQDIALRWPEAYRESVSGPTSSVNDAYSHSWNISCLTTKLICSLNPTPSGPRYPGSTSELKAMKTWMENNSNDGKIRKSNSTAASPTLLIPKLDGSLRLCVDYHGLNKITAKDRYPLPRMEELRDRLGMT